MRLEPGAWSSLRHWHAVEDEFIYVLEGTLTLLDDNGPHGGAVASAMVATKVQGLRALILTGGVYDLREACESSSRDLQQAIQKDRRFERKLLGSVGTPSFGQDSSGNLTSPRQVR